MQTQARRIVTKIDANPILVKQNDENGLLRVAAYCRVSTDSEDQLESYKAQVAYYTDAIAKIRDGVSLIFMRTRALRELWRRNAQILCE